MAEIYAAINGVMADVGAIGKDKTSVQQKFKYRGVDDVMNALQPAMVKHGIFVVPEIIEQRREERQTKTGGNLIYSVCTVRYTFYAKDGSSVQCVVIGEGMDSGDKATNKAMSIAFKYACFQVFCIPTEEMADPDAETHPASQRVAEDPKVAAAKAKANEVKRMLVKIMGNKTAAAQLWNEKYKQDAGDIVKMNAALLDLEDRLKQMEALA
jgi:hypothetical protein